jgi:hypothetical protein
LSISASIFLKRSPYGGLSKPAPLTRACRNTDFICEGAISATNDVLTGSSDDYGNLLSLSAQYKF